MTIVYSVCAYRIFKKNERYRYILSPLQTLFRPPLYNVKHTLRPFLRCKRLTGVTNTFKKLKLIYRLNSYIVSHR